MKLNLNVFCEIVSYAYKPLCPGCKYSAVHLVSCRGQQHAGLRCEALTVLTVWRLALCIISFKNIFETKCHKPAK